MYMYKYVTILYKIVWHIYVYVAIYYIKIHKIYKSQQGAG